MISRDNDGLGLSRRRDDGLPRDEMSRDEMPAPLSECWPDGHGALSGHVEPLTEEILKGWGISLQVSTVTNDKFNC